jgi:molecular chaperone DnaK (HSP70)
METLTKRYGETFMSMTQVQFVLTVPAVWSDSAKDATLKAAEKAGMGKKGDLKLISEPEAAAVYTLKAIQPNHLKIGDNFVVCDAGMPSNTIACPRRKFLDGKRTMYADND